MISAKLPKMGHMPSGRHHRPAVLTITTHGSANTNFSGLLAEA